MSAALDSLVRSLSYAPARSYALRLGHHLLHPASACVPEPPAQWSASVTRSVRRALLLPDASHACTRLRVGFAVAGSDTLLAERLAHRLLDVALLERARVLPVALDEQLRGQWSAALAHAADLRDVDLSSCHLPSPLPVSELLSHAPSAPAVLLLGANASSLSTSSTDLAYLPSVLSRASDGRLEMLCSSAPSLPDPLKPASPSLALALARWAQANSSTAPGQAAPVPAFDSVFEEQVYALLRSWGLDVDSQVWVEGFRLDLALRAPSGGYVLGVECDGGAFHSSNSARSRDTRREQVLASLGWRIHRISGQSWFHDRDFALRRLRTAVRQALPAIHLP